jgi:hypothetical protein
MTQRPANRNRTPETRAADRESIPHNSPAILP